MKAKLKQVKPLVKNNKTREEVSVSFADIETNFAEILAKLRLKKQSLTKSYELFVNRKGLMKKSNLEKPPPHGWGFSLLFAIIDGNE